MMVSTVFWNKQLKAWEKKVETLAAEVASIDGFAWTKEKRDGEVPDSSGGADQEPA